MTHVTRRSTLITCTLASVVAVMAMAMAMAWASSGTAAPPARLTTDPQPPLALDLARTHLQKNASGGIATLLVTVRASIAIEGAVVTLKTPANLVFADGSALRTWTPDLATPGALQSFPVEVIVPEDGRNVVSAEVTGTAGGKGIHRGTAYRLLVGVEEPRGRVRAGAIEYLAAEAAEQAP
jgi:hypothetical protein